MTPPKNMSASVRQRLLNRAKRDRRPFNELLQYYAMERFLYRLSKSAHAERFVLKGALMLRVWRSPELRPTMDIDMLGRTSNEEADIVVQIRDILTKNVATDGLAFDIDSIQAERIVEDADYKGVRILLRGNLGNIRLFLQIDVGFGDVIIPGPGKVKYPVLLDFPPPELRGYTMESTIAEKFQTIGLIGLKDGWQVVIGGNVGAEPRIAQEIASGLDDDGTLRAVNKIVQCYQDSAKKNERLGKTIDRIGLDPFKAALD
jgi:hypothetical protein